MVYFCLIGLHLAVGDLVFAVLQGVKLVVSALQVQQFLVVTLFHDLALGQQDNIVRMLNRGKAVGNDEHGTDIFHLFQGILDQDLRFRVDIGSCLIKDHHGRLVDNGTGKAEKLPLTGGEIVAPLTNLIVQALFQAADEGIGVDIPAGFHHFFVGDIVLAQQDIAADGTGEQEHILQHLTEMTAEAGQLDFLDINAVDEDLTLLDIVVTADKA